MKIFMVMYKSGAQIKVTASFVNIKISPTTGKMVQVEWATDISPRPLHWGISDIESIWEVR